MATTIERFAFEGRLVRIEMEGEAPWFCGGDICALLDLDPDVFRRLREDEKGPRSTRTLGGTQQTTWITEPGLYKLVLRSRKPEAERFQDWVTHEVLPAIRRTGSYSVPETREHLMARALVETQAVLAETTQALAIAAPKAQAWDEMADAHGDVNLQTAGKALQLPPNLWIAWLRQHGHLMYRGRNLVARQDHLDAGRFVQRVRVKDGEEFIQTLVTPRGLAYWGERRPELRPPRRILPRHPTGRLAALPGGQP